MQIEDLIGRKFKRNKYGLSIWEDTIKDINYKLQLIIPPNIKKKDMFNYLRIQKQLGKKYGHTLEISVLGNNTLTSYNINEIIVY